MTQEEAIDSIIEIIKNSDNDDLIDINNGYQDEVCGDCHIYHMDEFNDIMSSYSPLDLAFRVFYGGDFNKHKNAYFYLIKIHKKGLYLYENDNSKQ